MRKEVVTSGDHWKDKESVLFSVYTPVITVSLASKYNTKNRPKLLSIVILSPSVADFNAVFLLF